MGERNKRCKNSPKYQHFTRISIVFTYLENRRGGALVLTVQEVSTGATPAGCLVFCCTMGRMHSGGKGISKSALPYRRSVPSWQKMSADEVKEQIFKLARKGLSPSQIGECNSISLTNSQV